MPAFEVSRTLVKSSPEVWAELEKVERLAELLGDGAITITRRQPETEIEWQGSAATGKIEIAASAWGTKVRLTAEAAAVAEPAVEPIGEPDLESDDAPAPETAEVTPPEPEGRSSFWQRFKSLFAGVSNESLDDVAVEVSDEELESEPEPVSKPEDTADPQSDDDSRASERPDDFEARLTAVLDHLGSAHKRPFTAS